MKSTIAVFTSLASVIFAQHNLYPDCAQGPLAKNLVCDASLSPPERAAALVAAMTSDEKLQNLVRYAIKCCDTTIYKSFCS
jgi:hypothetical protein